MRKLFYSLLVLIALLCCHATSNAQSNKGTEFWTAYMDHVNGAGGNDGSQMSLYLVSTVNTSGTISVNDNSFATITFNLLANEPQEIAIPEEAFLGESNNDAPINKGIHIVASQPIAAYAHIYRSSVSGATLLLPVNSLGKEYYSINYTQVSNSLANNGEKKPSYSLFNIIATDDNTTIEITPKATLLSGQQANRAFTIQLNKGQVYQGLSSKDLTGTLIRSIASGTQICKKIAVFSGSSKMGIGCNANISAGTIDATSDNLFQQVYPTVTWGKNYYAVPLKGRDYDIFRVVYSDFSAQVKVNGSLVTPSNGFYEFTSKEPVVVTSDKPVQLVQYTVSQGEGLGCPTRPVSGDIGDPEMIFLPPIEQGLKQVTLFSTSKSGINSDRQFINVILPASATVSFKIDGNSYPGFTAMPQDPNYVYAQIKVTPGSHNISAASPFTAIAYGFGSRESYGYAAGTNLQNINEFIDLKENVNASTSLSNGCANTNYLVQLVVPYNSLPFIQWRSSDGIVIPKDNNPQVIGTRLSADGITTLYVYQLQTQINKSAGYYNITASIPSQGTNDDCGALHDIAFDFNISDFPDANFTTQAGTCINAPVTFTDVSDTKGSTLVSWSWKFNDPYSTPGNPDISTDQNPVHTFTHAGNYSVELSVVNANGCPSQIPKTMIIHINNIPIVHMESSSPDCATGSIAFLDKSDPVEGKIVSWLWNFGDPDATPAGNTSTEEKPSHIYAKAGTYTVTLQVSTDLSCVSAIGFSDIKVNPLPQANFTLPEACIKDIAKFKSTSTIADHTESDFTYEWNFGDGSAGTGAEPSHQYAQPGTYTVTLKVISKYKCEDTKVQTFILNGVIPKAEFSVANSIICSNEELVVEDKTIVNPGVVTKYEFYYDVDNNPTQVETYGTGYLPIPANKLFKHQYKTFTKPASKTYHIRIYVYSGSSAECSSVYDIPAVTVNAAPKVLLSYASEICEENQGFQITEDIGDFAGTGVSAYTGNGVTATGFFDPKKAGPGNHLINYIFTADGTGCTFMTPINIFVNPTPIITGKRNITINAGGSVTLEALAISLNGTNLKYAWSPALGLDRADVRNPVASPANDTQYQLKVTSENQCEAIALFNITVIQQPIIYNTFTPNGDGRNDTWEIPNMDDHPKAVVEVFNRNGQRVFYSIGYAVAWDGRFKGADLPAATYYYILDLKDGKKPLSGSLTIVR